MAGVSWGLAGAAAATAISQVLGSLIPILYFCRADAGVLRLTKTKIDGKALLKACTNGSSELMSNISTSIVSMLYNFQLMRYASENGIAIYGSAFFTALNDGLTSALISFLRSLLFQVAAVLILPLIFGIDGIWFSVVAAVMTILFIAVKRKKYHY